VSLDAMDWAWRHATAKGTARLVLLAIADKASGQDCTAYAGTTALMQRTRASRTAVRRAVDALLAAGELVVVEGARGPRGETRYAIPGAAGHTRGAPEVSPSEGDTNEPGQESDPGQNPTPGGTESDPVGGHNPTPRGPESDPHNAVVRREHKQTQQPRVHARDRSAVVEQLRPLDAALEAAGVDVRWSLGLGEQRDVWHLANRHGIPALVELAARRTRVGDEPKPARYWLRVWGDLDRTPAAPPAHPGGNVVPLRRGSPPTTADTLLAGLALLEEREGEHA
jgi:hypothetical protein